MKRMMSIAMVALFMAGSTAFAGSCGSCPDKKADKEASCSEKKECSSEKKAACTAEKKECSKAKKSCSK